MTTAQPLTRALYIALFTLKPLNEDGNFQVCMCCMHARKGASESPRTHFSGGVSPDPPHTIYSMDPTFCNCPGPPQSSRRPWRAHKYLSTIIGSIQSFSDWLICDSYMHLWLVEVKHSFQWTTWKIQLRKVANWNGYLFYILFLCRFSSACIGCNTNVRLI